HLGEVFRRIRLSRQDQPNELLLVVRRQAPVEELLITQAGMGNRAQILPTNTPCDMPGPDLDELGNLTPEPLQASEEGPCARLHRPCDLCCLLEQVRPAHVADKEEVPRKRTHRLICRL